MSRQYNYPWMEDQSDQGPPRADNIAQLANNALAISNVYNDFCQMQEVRIEGYGILDWLSSKAGILKTKDEKTISFQLTEFIDPHLVDLLKFVRAGFQLKFAARQTGGPNQYTASKVSPIFGEESERVFRDSEEINLEDFCKPKIHDKDYYVKVLEQQAYQAITNIFISHHQVYIPARPQPEIMLSNIQNRQGREPSEDDRLFQYMGTSSMKRRHFIELRTQIFCFTHNDVFSLQFPAVYEAVTRLSSRLLCRGGSTSVHCLYNYYLSDAIPQYVRDFIGSKTESFLKLLTSHPFAFAVFPEKTYVSARRNLPDFDYTGFVAQYFPEFLDDQYQKILRQRSRFVDQDFFTMQPQSNQHLLMPVQNQYMAPPQMAHQMAHQMAPQMAHQMAPQIAHQMAPQMVPQMVPPMEYPKRDQYPINLDSLSLGLSDCSLSGGRVSQQKTDDSHWLNGLSNTTVIQPRRILPTPDQTKQAKDGETKCTCKCTCGIGNGPLNTINEHLMPNGRNNGRDNGRVPTNGAPQVPRSLLTLPPFIPHSNGFNEFESVPSTSNAPLSPGVYDLFGEYKIRPAQNQNPWKNP